MATTGCIETTTGSGSGSGTGTGDGAGDGAGDGPGRIEDGTVEAGGADLGSSITIDRVIDGDSLEATVEGQPTEIRLLGINAPELRTVAGTETCAGRTARDELDGLLAGATTLRFLADDVDRFGRQLGVIVADGIPVTESMVAAGWALALWSGDDPALVELMRSAADAERGWWGTGCGTPAGPGLAFGGEQANPPGPDGDRLADEWVEVVNDGPQPIDLDGWTIRDETTSNRFVIEGVVIEAGAAVRFRTGSGSSTATDYFLGEEFPFWSNGGDTALLIDPDGAIAAHRFIG